MKFKRLGTIKATRAFGEDRLRHMLELPTGGATDYLWDLLEAREPPFAASAPHCYTETRLWRLARDPDKEL